MNKKFGFYSDKSAAISYESQLSGLEEQTKALLVELRNFVKSLGSNVIEEIRPHRIVYAKSLTFRTFLDVQPRNDCLIISVRKGRTAPTITYMVKSEQELEDIKHQIAEACETIK
jgi:hypothetical protein